ncbi:hypothetical protein ACFQZ2_22045, partial [Streptomonospora algeriensis]
YGAAGAERGGEVSASSDSGGTAEGAEAESDEEDDGAAAEDGAFGDGGPESARDHFRYGTQLLRDSFQDSVSDLQDQVSDSVSLWHDRIQRHRPESVGDLLTSIRDSTDTLGLTSSGKHREGSSLPVVLAVVAGVLLLLGVVLWALLFRA